jgi:alginate O-acetyltransferase complex protein AlgI
MVFNSYSFIVFFFAVLGCYYAVRSWRVRKGILVAASYVLYAAWNPPFVVLLWVSTMVSWSAVRGIHASSTPRTRRFFAGLALAAGLGVLTYFKYGAFLLHNFLLLTQTLGWHVSLAMPDIILPVGISFYTFRTLSYTLDVYRGKIAPSNSFLDYALYVTFFPQLLAGPIVRPGDFLSQCEQPRPFSTRMFGWGLCLMLIGLFEKVAIADGILAPIVDAIYDVSDSPDFVSAWCGTLAFAGQIFLDLAGYSLCAIGAASCLGFATQDNFRFPYAAVGFSDFWQRWHISLSSWFRDYLYIPLGGNRRGPGRTLANLMITMFVGGLWHGASWTFAIWGGLHGLYLVLERGVRKIMPWRLEHRAITRAPMVLLTFVLVCVAWVFFRAHSFTQAFGVVGAMFGFASSSGERLLQTESVVLSLGVIATVLSVHWWMRETSIASIAARIPWWARSAVLAALFIGIIGLSGEDHAFIYFHF